MIAEGDQCSDKKRSISSRMLPTCSIFRTINIFCVNSRGKRRWRQTEDCGFADIAEDERSDLAHEVFGRTNELPDLTNEVADLKSAVPGVARTRSRIA